ncbi:MAG: serine hydrolase [Bacteroidetes bacterium]|nr:serine hydrolase [Bacteroidota bacterium]
MVRGIIGILNLWVSLLLSAAIVFPITGSAQQARNDDFLFRLMKSKPAEFKRFTDKAKAYDIQILYTKIDRTESNSPQFSSYSYRLDTSRYFYPASTVKFPMVLLALEKMNRLGISGLNRFTPLKLDSAWSGQRKITSDTTAFGGVPTIDHLARKIFLVSDNEAFNTLYAFVGQQDANAALRRKGYQARILHRLSRGGLTAAENRRTEPVTFYRRDSLLWSQPMLMADSVPVHKKVFRAKGYYENGRLIRKPMDFSYKNFFSLKDQQDMLIALLFPEATDRARQFNLRPDDRRAVLQYMSQWPSETRYPAYFQDSTFHNGYAKYLLSGGEAGTIPSGVRIFNKIGGAYGYIIDNAYIVDFENKIEFLLSAVIYTNRDGILNDDRYDYETDAMPFMRSLGRLIYDHERSRFRSTVPDLSAFELSYDLKH